VFQLCGAELVDECARAEHCPTGDAVLTRAFHLPCAHIIHTVGPRFSVKYQTAAENALHSCYRRSLEVLRDAALTTVAFGVVNTERKGYPRVSAAHIALRTLRRFLETYGKGVQALVWCVNNPADWNIYEVSRRRRAPTWPGPALPLCCAAAVMCCAVLCCAAGCWVLGAGCCAHRPPLLTWRMACGVWRVVAWRVACGVWRVACGGMAWRGVAWVGAGWRGAARRVGRVCCLCTSRAVRWRWRTPRVCFQRTRAMRGVKL
jgi:O-acetyl-ADP-ribose deacetylase (regulator of RNase III)